MNSNDMAVMGLAAEMAGSSPVSLQQALSSCSSSIGSEDDDDDILLKVFWHSTPEKCNANTFCLFQEVDLIDTDDISMYVGDESVGANPTLAEQLLQGMDNSHDGVFLSQPTTSSEDKSSLQEKLGLLKR
jgi:hypothetical protein